MRRSLHAVALLAALALLVACGSPPRTRYYLLEVRDLARAPAGEPVAIAVGPFAVDAPYDQDRLVYRVGQDAVEVGFYEYHRWAAPLARMLEDLAAGALRARDDVGRVELLAHAGPAPALVLDGRLHVLEEVDTPAGERVRYELELRLHDPERREVWSELLAGETPIEVDQPGVEDVARAMGRALAEAIRTVRLPPA